MRNNLETRCRQKRPNTWDKTENFETFFIDAKYNFRSGDWISGGYKINPSHWKNSTSDRNLAKRNFPILNDRFGITDNFLAVKKSVRLIIPIDDYIG